MVKAGEELRKGHSRSVWTAEWSESDGLLHFRGKIYVPDGKDLHCQIVSNTMTPEWQDTLAGGRHWS